MNQTSYMKFMSIALNKYRKMDHYFPGQEKAEQRLMKETLTKPSRLIVRKGIEYVALKTKDVAMIYTENKIVYVADASGKKYFGEKNMAEMEAVLDNRFFFRMNRQYLVNINFIKAFRSFEKVKLLVELEVPGIKKEIVISQENAPSFRQWIYQA